MHPSLAHAMSNCTRSENRDEYRKQDRNGCHLGLAHHTKKREMDKVWAKRGKQPRASLHSLSFSPLSIHYQLGGQTILQNMNEGYHFQVTLKCFLILTIISLASFPICTFHQHSSTTVPSVPSLMLCFMTYFGIVVMEKTLLNRRTSQVRSQKFNQVKRPQWVRECPSAVSKSRTWRPGTSFATFFRKRRTLDILLGP